MFFSAKFFKLEKHDRRPQDNRSSDDRPRLQTHWRGKLARMLLKQLKEMFLSPKRFKGQLLVGGGQLKKTGLGRYLLFFFFFFWGGAGEFCYF